MTTELYNPAAHEFFVATGYVYKHYDCEIFDDGDGESGPMVTGSPDTDTYELGNELVTIDFNGHAEKYLVCPDPPVDPMSEDWQS